MCIIIIAIAPVIAIVDVVSIVILQRLLLCFPLPSIREEAEVVCPATEFGIMFQDGADFLKGGSVGGDVLNNFGVVKEEDGFDDGGKLHSVWMRVVVVVVIVPAAVITVQRE